MRSLRRRSWLGDALVLILLAAVSLLLMSSGDWIRRQSAGALHALLYYPLEKTVAGGRNIWTLRQENERLRSEAARLSAENARLAEAVAENARFRRALGFREHMAVAMIPAEVIGRRGGIFEPILLVDQGSLAGVRENMAVVAPEGLVGRVIQADPGMSWVMVLAHPDCRVSALVKRSRVAGIVEARPGGHLVLSGIPHLADIGPGDLVVSSGLGGVFPAGWPIGDAAGLTEEFGGLLDRVDLRPRVDFLKVEEVFILLAGAEGPADDLLPPQYPGPDVRNLP